MRQSLEMYLLQARNKKKRRRRSHCDNRQERVGKYRQQRDFVINCTARYLTWLHFTSHSLSVFDIKTWTEIFTVLAVTMTLHWYDGSMFLKMEKEKKSSFRFKG